MTALATELGAGEPFEIEPPDVSGIIIEDDTPVDNFTSEKQQRLLTEPLYTSWAGPPPNPELELEGEGARGPRSFLVAANVGLFSTLAEPPIVPDVFLSLDVKVGEDLSKKENRTYFFWVMGKAPEVAIEIVSNREGGELYGKKQRYRALRISYYVVWDPEGFYEEPRLRGFELRGDLYVPMSNLVFPSVGLGLRVWEGEFERQAGEWLRWTLLDGTIVPTGAERAEAERARAEAERKRAERLAAKLRELGIDPTKI